MAFACGDNPIRRAVARDALDRVDTPKGPRDAYVCSAGQPNQGANSHGGQQSRGPAVTGANRLRTTDFGSRQALTRGPTSRGPTASGANITGANRLRATDFGSRQALARGPTSRGPTVTVANRLRKPDFGSRQALTRGPTSRGPTLTGAKRLRTPLREEGSDTVRRGQGLLRGGRPAAGSGRGGAHDMAYLEGGPAERHGQRAPVAGFLAYMNWKPL